MPRHHVPSRRVVQLGRQECSRSLHDPLPCRAEDVIPVVAQPGLQDLQQELGSLGPEANRREVIIRLRGMCYEHQDEIIKEAEALGLDPSEVDDKTGVTGRTDSRNGNGSHARMQPSTGLGAGSPGPGRELVRRTTEEEIQRLERKQRLLQMTRELQRDEAALARGWAGGSRRLACPRIRLPLRQRPPFVCLVSNEMQALLCMELAEQCRERPKNSSSRSSSCRGSSSIIRQLQHHQAAAAVAAACCCLPFCSLLPCFLLVV